MARRGRLQLKAAGVLSPFEQLLVSIATPTGAWVAVSDVVESAPMTQVNGTNELMTQIYDA
jgi:hypothetical protein